MPELLPEAVRPPAPVKATVWMPVCVAVNTHGVYPPVAPAPASSCARLAMSPRPDWLATHDSAFGLPGTSAGGVVVVTTPGAHTTMSDAAVPTCDEPSCMRSPAWRYTWKSVRRYTCDAPAATPAALGTGP